MYILCICSVFNLRHIRTMSSDTFSWKLACTNILFYYAAIFNNYPSLYAPIPLDLQMKSCTKDVLFLSTYFRHLEGV